MTAAQEGSRSFPGRFRGVSDGPTGVSNNPKGLQDTPRRPQDGPQDAPRSNSARGHACDYVCALAKSSRKQLCPAKGLTRCSRAAQGEALVSYIPCAPRGRPDRGLLWSYRAYTCWAHCEMRSVDWRSFATFPSTCVAHVCLHILALHCSCILVPWQRVAL